MGTNNSIPKALQSLALRTWPNQKVKFTVTTAGTPVVADISAYVGRTCYFRANGGKIFGARFQNGETAPTLVDGEDFEIADGSTEELVILGDEDVRLTIDSDTDGAELVVLYDDNV